MKTLEYFSREAIISRRTFLKGCAVSLASAIPAVALLTSCGPNGPAPAPSPTPTPTTPTVISTVTTTLIATAATVATGAVLDFAVTQASSRTQLANQIYAAASALYQASGGTALTPAALTALLASYGINGVSQYTGFASAIEGLYSTYYTKWVTDGSVGVQNFAAIVNAIAQGAEAGAQAYETVTTTATT